MQIQVDNYIYEFAFKTIQLEVTGRCNLKCSHCRASYDPLDHIRLPLVEKLFQFAEVEDEFNITISGGEPFANPNLIDLLRLVRTRNPNELVITTNGYSVKEFLVDKILDLSFNKTTFQVSLDSCDPNTHNAFRGKADSYEKALRTINMLSGKGVFTSVRSTLTPDTLDQMEKIIELVTTHGAKRVSFGTVVPSGSAVNHESLFVSKEQKKKHIENLINVKDKFNNIAEIVTEDPLKLIPKNSQWHHIDDEIKLHPGYIPGCDAGITQINMYSNGDVTPCALFNKTILNLNSLSVEEAKHRYVNSDVIKSLFRKKFSGKCASCPNISLCGGGCRAIPYGLLGDHLGADSTCFY